MPRTRRRRTSRFLDAGRPLIRVPARTALAAGVAACALLAVGALEPMLAHAYFFPTLTGVLLISMLAGARYAILTAAVVAAGFAYLYLEPRGSLSLVARGDAWVLAAYLLSAAFIAAMGGALRAAHARLRDQNRILRGVQDQREDVLRALTHDIRSPLAAITMTTGLLSRATQDPEVLRRAEVIERSAKRVAEMLTELVETARIESGHFALQRRAIDLATLVDELRGRFAGSLGGERIDVAIPEGLPRVHVDPQRFERVLVNLLSNALKYAPPPTRVTVGAAAHKQRVVVSVVDRGPGIDREHLPYLFEKYYRAGDPRAKEGLGLGLYVARLITEAHGGRIWVESTVGTGTTFHVSVPVAPEATRDRGPIERRTPPSTEGFGEAAPRR